MNEGSGHFVTIVGFYHCLCVFVEEYSFAKINFSEGMKAEYVHRTIREMLFSFINIRRNVLFFRVQSCFNPTYPLIPSTPVDLKARVSSRLSEDSVS